MLPGKLDMVRVSIDPSNFRIVYTGPFGVCERIQTVFPVPPSYVDDAGTALLESRKAKLAGLLARALVETYVNVVERQHLAKLTFSPIVQSKLYWKKLNTTRPSFTLPPLRAKSSHRFEGLVEPARPLAGIAHNMFIEAATTPAPLEWMDEPDFSPEEES